MIARIIDLSIANRLIIVLAAIAVTLAGFWAVRATRFARILTLGRGPQMQPFMTLWWEIVAGSARGLPGYKDAAEAMMVKQLAWMEGQMPEDDPDPEGGARYLMTLLEGTLMLGTVGHARMAREGLLASGLAGDTADD